MTALEAAGEIYNLTRYGLVIEDAREDVTCLLSRLNAFLLRFLIELKKNIEP